MDADADVAQKRNALMSDTDATLTELCEDGQDFHGNRTLMSVTQAVIGRLCIVNIS